MKYLTPEQSRAARALLNWSRERLAQESEVSVATLAEFELGKRTCQARTMRDLINAFEAAGIELIPEDSAGVGVRFRRPSQNKGRAG